MNSKNLKTLEAIFSPPTKANINWLDIESLLLAVGTKIIEGSGSRVRFVKDDMVMAFHRPRPAKEAKIYQVKDARFFLEILRVKP